MERLMIRVEAGIPVYFSRVEVGISVDFSRVEVGIPADFSWWPAKDLHHDWLLSCLEGPHGVLMTGPGHVLTVHLTRQGHQGSPEVTWVQERARAM